MVRHQSDVVRRDIRMSSGHPMAVGSDVRVGRVGWMTDILWISVCYQGRHGIDAALNWRQDTGDCPARFFRELMLAPNVMYVFDLYSAFSTRFTNNQRRFQFIKMRYTHHSIFNVVFLKAIKNPVLCMLPPRALLTVYLQLQKNGSSLVQSLWE